MDDDIEILIYNMTQDVSEVIENIEKNKFDMNKLTQNEKSRLKIFDEYMDLHETYQSIKNCIIYINSFPFYPRVEKVVYLKFIYSAYLNEIYILQSRISKLTKIIERSLKEYKEENNYTKDFSIVKNCTENAVNRFKKIIGVRGEHVHVKRYTTESINNVESYEFISKFNETEKYKRAFKDEIKKLKKNYADKLKKNQEQIDNILKVYLKSINEFLLTKEYIKKAK